jgi:hypothetical protein
MLAVIAVQRAHAQTPVEWPVAAGGNGHWYEIVPLGGPSDLAVAEYAAQMRRGRLAELESAGEHGFVVAALAAGAAEGSAFLGARRVEQMGFARRATHSHGSVMLRRRAWSMSS